MTESELPSMRGAGRSKTDTKMETAEDRFASESWKNYELWEKVENRGKRARLRWIIGTLCIFILLMCIPTVMRAWPAWNALHQARLLAEEIGECKKKSALLRQACRIRFLEPENSVYLIEESPACDAGQWSEINRVELPDGLVGVPASKSTELQVAGLVLGWCYDPLRGSDVDLGAFAIAPVMDLTGDLPGGPLKRAATVLLRGPSAEVEFASPLL